MEIGSTQKALLARMDGVSGDRRARAEAVGKEFEAVFLADAFKLMFKDVDVDPLNGDDNNGNQSWRELLVDEYAKSMVARGGIGLASQISRELLAVQEASNP